MNEQNEDILPAAAGSHQPCGIDLIKAERDRQIAKGWSVDHDDTHSSFEMPMAAICYAAAAADERPYFKQEHKLRNERWVKFYDPWPWEWNSDKRPTWKSSRIQRVRMLEKAGALIAAEIDRLLRLEARGKWRTQAKSA